MCREWRDLRWVIPVVLSYRMIYRPERASNEQTQTTSNNYEPQKRSRSTWYIKIFTISTQLVFLQIYSSRGIFIVLLKRTRYSVCLTGKIWSWQNCKGNLYKCRKFALNLLYCYAASPCQPFLTVTCSSPLFQGYFLARWVDKG